MSIVKGNHAGLGGAGAPGGPLGGGGILGDHAIDQSLRFEDGDSPALSKAYSTAQTNTKILTISVWVKRANLGIRTTILYAKSGGTAAKLSFQTTDKLYFNAFNTGYNGFESSAVFRDTSAWYHIVAQADSQDQTGANINRVWVNGVELENSKTSVFVPDDTASMLLRNGVTTYIGDDIDGAYHFDGYLAEMHVIDGSVVAPTSFGETIGGVWVPKRYSGSYGTNGFYLTFEATGTATTTQGTTAQINIGDDQSGAGNNFAVSGLAAEDQVPDSPTNNFATLNPLAEDDKNIKSGAVLSEGNLVTATAGFGSGTPWGGGQSTIAIPTDKKIYCEMLCSNATGSSWAGGVSIPELNSNSTGVSNVGQIAAYNRSAMINGVETDYGASAGLGGLGVAKLAVDDILQIAVDGATGKVWFGRNGTYFKSPSTNNSGTTGDPAAGTHEIGTVTNTDGKPLFIVVMGNSSTVHVNFGQDSSFAGRKTSGSAEAQDANGIGDFYYAPPTDYVCLAASSLSEPTISPNAEAQADDYFNTVLYTGTGSSQSITGVGFQPDWVWIKGRSNARRHMLFDVVRGVQNRLITDDTNTELTMTDGLSSFDSDGFTEGGNLNTGNTGETLVAWNWKAGGTAASIAVDEYSSGVPSIASSVSAAPDAGFSVVSYTGTGSAGETVGHGLSSAPEMIIVKSRTEAVGWYVYHSKVTSDPEKRFLRLDNTDDVSAINDGPWNNTAPSASVFTLGDGGSTNRNTEDYIAYCFHSVEGYSKVGSYVGNGSTDGTFVYTGFRPAWVLLKDADSSSDWQMYDSKRYAFNKNNVTEVLEANQNNTETTTINELDLLSNGFKLRSTNTFSNKSSNFIYLAFAEQPFKYSNAR